MLFFASEVSSSGRNAARNLSVSSQGLVRSLQLSLIKSKDRRVGAQAAAGTGSLRDSVQKSAERGVKCATLMTIRIKGRILDVLVNISERDTAVSRVQCASIQGYSYV